jgi:predicted N-acyltransferase
VDIALVETISQIDPEEWEELVKGSITASYDWLRLVEDTSLVGRQYHVLLAREKSRLKAAILFRKQLPASNEISLDDVLFGRLMPLLKKLALSTLPALVGHDTVGHQRTILFKDKLPGRNRKLILAEMLEFIEKVALENGLTLCLRGIPAEDTDLASVFLSRHYICVPEWPVCYLDIQWQSFGKYLQSLRKHHPKTAKNIHREINQSRRAGITFQCLDDPKPAAKHLHAIISSHFLQLNGMPSPFRPEFFEQIKLRLGDGATINTAVRGGRIIGVQVRLQRDGNAILPMIGIDKDYFHKHAVYFNLGYNQAIRNAIEEGFRRIGFGSLFYDTKVRRGCVVSNSSLYLRPRGNIAGMLLHSLMPFRTLKMRSSLLPIAEFSHHKSTSTQ